ncbi:hypothetical protein ES703_10301 [subsurface metagenome]
MQQLHFTTPVLGTLAAYKLMKRQVTQTLRSKESSITPVIPSGQLKVGDQMKVTLDNTNIGLVEFVAIDAVTWVGLNAKDATRGGFDNLDDLKRALQRAGYRFKPINQYQLYRIKFSWLKETIPEEAAEKMEGRRLW